MLTQEELEGQIEKRRIAMEKRQVTEEEQRQFQPEMDLEPVSWVALFRCWLYQAEDISLNR